MVTEGLPQIRLHDLLCKDYSFWRLFPIHLRAKDLDLTLAIENPRLFLYTFLSLQFPGDSNKSIEEFIKSLSNEEVKHIAQLVFRRMVMGIYRSHQESDLKKIIHHLTVWLLREGFFDLENDPEVVDKITDHLKENYESLREDIGSYTGLKFKSKHLNLTEQVEEFDYKRKFDSTSSKQKIKARPEPSKKVKTERKKIQKSQDITRAQEIFPEKIEEKTLPQPQEKVKKSEDILRDKKAPVSRLDEVQELPSDIETSIELPMYSAEKKRRASLLEGLFGLVLLPLTLVFHLGMGIGKLVGKLVSSTLRLRGKLKKYFTQKRSDAKRKCLYLMEEYLSGQAAEPGFLERFCAQFKIIILLFHHLLGLSFVTFIVLVDNVVSIFVSYIQNIYQTWRHMKTLHRRLSRGEKIAEYFAQDHEQVSRQVSHIFSFYFFRKEGPEKNFYSEQAYQKEFPCCALEAVLDTRNKIDQLRRDLALLTSAQGKETARSTAFEFLSSFIPNPLDFLSPLKDWFILRFCIKYQRQDLEFTYVKFIISHNLVLQFLEEEGFSLNQEKSDSWFLLKPLQHNELIMKQVKKSLKKKDLSPEVSSLIRKKKVSSMKEAIEFYQESLQRLQQMLFSCQALAYPKNWFLWQIGQALYKFKWQYNLVECDPLYLLEWEKRLRPLIAQELKKMEHDISDEERKRRSWENKDWQYRYRWNKRNFLRY